MMTRFALASVGLIVVAAGFWGHQRITRLEERLLRIEGLDSDLSGPNPSGPGASELGIRIQRLEAHIGDSRRPIEDPTRPDPQPESTPTAGTPHSVTSMTVPPKPNWEWSPEKLAEIRTAAGFGSFAHAVRETTLEILMQLPRSPSEAELLGVASAVRNWHSETAELDSLPAPERDRRREESDQRFRAQLQAHFPGPEGLSISSGLVSRGPP